MSYKDFTLDRLHKEFGLGIDSYQDLFSERNPGASPDSAFLNYLNYSVPLALAINTEKARSEMIIAPILIELKRLLRDEVSLFSGTEFNVDSERGLTGYCDFLVSASRQQLYISVPVLVIVEAKNENIKAGLGQCIAAMLAAQMFNEREGNPISAIYGAVTTGNQWKFIKLDQSTAWVDRKDYYIDHIETILGILSSMVQPLSVGLAT
jgi:hypothetical protein